MSNLETKFRPITKGQEILFKEIETNIITFCTGYSRTGKTYCACGIAAEMLKANRTKKILLTRPTIECGSPLGYLPGELKNKFDPFMRPLEDAFLDFFTENEFNKLIKDEVIEMCPLAYMRGRRLHHTVVILDEAQNTSMKQLKMFVTRLGKQSRMIICGDIKQSDIFEDDPPLIKMAQKLCVNENISHVKLGKEDIVGENGIFQFIIESIEDL